MDGRGLEVLESQQPEEPWTARLRTNFRSSLKKHRQKMKLFFLFLVSLLVFVYLVFAIRHSLQGSIAVMVLLSIFIVLVSYEAIMKKYGSSCDCSSLIATRFCQKYGEYLKWFSACAAFILMVAYISFSVIQTVRQLQSLAGFTVCFFLSVITCKYPTCIQWRPVLWGFGLQLTLGAFILRWRLGYIAIEWLSQQINEFVFYGLEGAGQLFGDPFLLLHPFPFLVIPLVVYLGAFMTLLYQLGATQYVTRKFGWLMSYTVHTTAVESVSLVANIFLSPLDTFFLMKPYLDKLTLSELHCFLVGSHSTIAGFAYGILVIFGVSANHLLAASVVSAPAAIAIAKLNFPETEKSRLKSFDDLQEQKSPEESNPIEAFTNGVTSAGKTVANLMIQILAFYGLYAFLDSVVGYIGSRVGFEITIAKALGYIFMPLSFLLGVDWENSQQVGELLGVKVTISELFAYFELGKLNTLGLISKRSNAIATYALCGFSSFGTLASTSAIWMTVSRQRWAEIIRLMPRILMNANIACFMTACIAGVFYVDEWADEREENPWIKFFVTMLEFMPSYKELMGYLNY